MPRAPKILIVRVGLGGDLVMITPALRALLTARPDVELHLLTTSEGARTLRGFDPRLVRYWTYRRRFPARLAIERRLLPLLRAEGFEQVICLETRPFYRRWLRDVAPQWFAPDATDPGEHAVARNLAVIARATGRPVASPWLELPVTEGGRERASELLMAAGIIEDTTLVGMHATYSGSRRPWPWHDRHGRRHRLWPTASWIELGRELVAGAAGRGRPLRLLLDVLPDERSLVAAIAAAVGDEAIILSAPPDFERYKALLARLDLLVTPNTGPMHMAAAVGTPVVALFSGWSAADCGPWVPTERQTVVTAPAVDQRLAAIEPATVAEAVFAQLARPAR